MSTENATPEQLIEMLNSDDVALRKKAVFKLGEIKFKSAIPKLIDLLTHDSDKVVRNNAARALGKINDIETKESAVDGLIIALNDKDYYVRSNAAWSLGRLKHKKAVEALSKIADASEHIYMSSGDGAISGAGVITAKDKKEEGVQYSDVIVKSIEALGEIGDEAALPTLLKSLKDEEDGAVRCAAALALGKLNKKDATPALIEALNDKFWYVRRDVAKALMQLKDERAIQPLSAKMSDMYDEVREIVMKALMAIGKPAHRLIFQLYLKNPKNPVLQTFVKQTLSKEDIVGILDEMIQNEPDSNKKQVLGKYKAAFAGAPKN